METQKQTQKMSVYFPLDLLEKVRKSAKQHRRSFNGEVLWIIQEYLEQTNRSEKR